MESVKVTDLKKYYQQVKAVDGLSFTVNQGEIFGMLGPNGAGKTTTVEIIAGLTSKDSGEIKVMGLDPAKDPLAVKARIGVQLQTAALFPRLTVLETINLYAHFYPNRMNITEVIEIVGLSEKSNVQTTNLSGGQLQRLSVALALVGNGDVIFLDEPTTGLDPQARRALWTLITQIKEKGKTVLLTTHYLDEAEILCDRVAVVDRGKIIALDSPKKLINEHFPEKAIEFKLEKPEVDQVFLQLQGVKRVKQEEDTVVLYTSEILTTISSLFHYAQKVGVQIDGLNVRTATLEDVFLGLTGRRLRE